MAERLAAVSDFDSLEVGAKFRWNLGSPKLQTAEKLGPTDYRYVHITPDKRFPIREPGTKSTVRVYPVVEVPAIKAN
jgi:hypothetical protein